MLAIFGLCWLSAIQTPPVAGAVGAPSQKQFGPRACRKSGMAAVSTIPSEYLEDVSDERSLGAVSSLSSEDDVTTVEHNSLDWYAVVQRTAKQRLQDLHKNKASAPAAQNAALRREAATPTIVTVVRPSKETGAAKSEWTTGATTALDVALGPGRLGASWRRTFPVAFGVGVGGGTGPVSYTHLTLPTKRIV